MASFKTYFNICLDGLRENLARSSRSCSRYSNPEPLEYEARQVGLQRDVWY
jgi:hypothetical protein